MAEAAESTSPASPAATPADSPAGGATPGAGEVAPGEGAAADPVGSFLALDVAGLSSENAQAEIAKIRHAALDDAGHPFNDHRSPQHKAVQTRINELYAQAYPGTVDADTASEAVLAEAPGPPETPEDYDLRQAVVGEGVPQDQVEEEMTLIRGWAHTAGFSQGEVGELIGSYNELRRQPDQQDDAFDTAHAATCERALRAVWGDQYDTKFAAAQRAAEKLGPEFLEFLHASRMGNEPRLARYLANAAEKKKW